MFDPQDVGVTLVSQNESLTLKIESRFMDHVPMNGHAGGSKRRRELPDFQRFSSGAAVFRRLSPHANFLLFRGVNPPKNLEKNVLLTYI
jgi:hypothetical protein